jgi:hypothetical protein
MNTLLPLTNEKAKRGTGVRDAGFRAIEVGAATGTIHSNWHNGYRIDDCAKSGEAFIARQEAMASILRISTPPNTE